jgi:pyrroline-5-carboxylate reductase
VVVHEEVLDVVTALSGSGPAYVYRLVEAMIHAGIDLGLSGDLARRLTLQTLVGAARMLTESREDPSELRRRVTSPGGTTMAALGVLDDRGFAQAVRDAISRAAERARELAEEFAIRAQDARSEA